MKTAAAAACAALALAAFLPLGSGQPAAAQRAQESGKASAPLIDVSQPEPGVAAAEPAPWASDYGNLDAHQIAHSLHDMMPSAHGDSPPVALVNDIEAALRNPDPIWANHSHAERTEQLRLNLGERGKRYRAERRATHRRMQGKWADSSDAAKDTNLVERIGPAAASCDDPL
eukprot:COSAG04_NODE_6699_length_1274_cov_1.689362_1_plen_171_part_10